MANPLKTVGNGASGVFEGILKTVGKVTNILVRQATGATTLIAGAILVAA